MRLAVAARLASSGDARIPGSRIKRTISAVQRLTDASQITRLNGTATVVTETNDSAAGQTSHVKFTGFGTSGSTFGFTPTTPFNLTQNLFRFYMRLSSYTGAKNLIWRLATTKASYDAGNYLVYQAKAYAADAKVGNWFVPGLWVHDAIAPANLTTTGSGADLSSIGYMSIAMSDVSSGSPVTAELAYVQAVAKLQNTKARMVFWHDDSISAGGLAMKAKLDPYGWKFTEAHEWGTNEAGTVYYSTSQIAALRAAGVQFSAHAFQSSEHVAVTEAQFVDQARRTKQQAARFGAMPDAADFTYWGSLQSGVGLAQVRRIYRSGRWNTASLDKCETLPPAESSFMKGYLQSTGDTFTTNWKPIIDAAIASKGLVQMIFHQDLDTNAATKTEFDSLLSYLDTNRASIDVMTFQQAIADLL